jgi:hypothetical protein
MLNRDRMQGKRKYKQPATVVPVLNIPNTCPKKLEGRERLVNYWKTWYTKQRGN